MDRTKIPTLAESQRRIDAVIGRLTGRSDGLESMSPELAESEHRIDRALRGMDGRPVEEAEPTLYAMSEHGAAVAKIALVEGAALADAEAFVKAGKVRGATTVVEIGAGKAVHERVAVALGLTPDEPSMRTYTVERQKADAGGETRISESAGLMPIGLAEGKTRNGRRVHMLDDLNVPDGATIAFNEAYGVERINGELVK